LEKFIAKFEKNVSEEVWVQLREFRGHQLLDVRVHFRPDDGSEARPTKKGISLSVNLIPKVLEAMQEALQALKDAGIEPEPSEPDASTPAGTDS